MANPGYTAAACVIELDGRPDGRVSDARLPVLTRLPAEAAPPTLHQGAFEATVSPVENPQLCDWLMLLARGERLRKPGALLVGDRYATGTRRIEWVDGEPLELRWRTLDAGSREPLVGFARWQSQQVEPLASGAPMAGSTGTAKPWLCSNFRVNGLPFAAQAVRSVVLPSIGVVSAAAATTRRPPLGELAVTLVAQSVRPALGYVQKLIDNPKPGDGDRFDCSIELLDPSFTRVLGQFDLQGCALRRCEETLPLGPGQDGSGAVTLGFAVTGFALKRIAAR